MGVLAKWAAAITGLELEASTLVPPSPVIPGWPLAPIGTTHLEPFTVAHGLLGWGREMAMSLPTISRARTLLTSQVARLPLDRFRVDEFGDIGERLPAFPWQLNPDPTRTRGWMIAWTVDDLMFHGYAYWHVVDRYADTGFPRTFERMVFDEVQIDSAGRVRWGADEVDPDDVVQFVGLIPGILAHGARAMGIALELDTAAHRFAATEVPAGVLVANPDMEQLTSEQLDADAAAFGTRRRTNVIAAVQGYSYQESTMDPGRLQLVDGRQYQALELARLADIPPYLVGAPAGTGMTYQNAQQAVSDLLTFGAAPHLTCIEETLSLPWVTPRGQAIRFRLPAEPSVVREEPADEAGADRPA